MYWFSCYIIQFIIKVFCFQTPNLKCWKKEIIKKFLMLEMVHHGFGSVRIRIRIKIKWILSSKHCICGYFFFQKEKGAPPPPLAPLTLYFNGYPYTYVCVAHLASLCRKIECSFWIETCPCTIYDSGIEMCFMHWHGKNGNTVPSPSYSHICAPVGLSDWLSVC